jgi:N-acetylmuramoyl-L-alanine amidase
LLYLTTPNLRGHDVSVLQDALSVLGFDPGRVDGIFGPLTQKALEDFQRDCGLSATGELTRATLVELERLAPRHAERTTVSEAKALAEFHRESPSNLIAVWGDELWCDALIAQLDGQLPHIVLAGAGYEAAIEANQAAPGFVIAFQRSDEMSSPSLSFYESLRFRSATGAHLAQRVRELFGSQGEISIGGLAAPILRETKSAALLIHVPVSGSPNESGLISALSQALIEVIHRN